MRVVHSSHKMHRTWDEIKGQYEMCVYCHFCECHGLDILAIPCTSHVKKEFDGLINASARLP